MLSLVEEGLLHVEHLGPWKAVALMALALPAHAAVRAARDAVPHPTDVGFYRSVGLNIRAHRHYRHRLPDGRGLHIQVFGDHYRIHWDRVDPSHSLMGHFLNDVVRALLRPFRRAVQDHAEAPAAPIEPADLAAQA